jgi:sulfite exporter TauE/SafE
MTAEVFASVFAASLLGSLHCVGMCGGFVAFYSGSNGRQPSTQWSHLTYNLGRLLTYAGLGVFAGFVGGALNLAGHWSGAGEIASLVAGTLIIAWGLVLLLQVTTQLKLQTPRWLDRLLGQVLPRLQRRPPLVRALILGMSSTLLPCGWLYGFAVTAAGSGSALGGASIMGAFWLGTLPAMLGVGFGAHKLAKVIGPRLPVLMPVMLLVIGVATLSHRGLGLW